MILAILMFLLNSDMFPYIYAIILDFYKLLMEILNTKTIPGANSMQYRYRSRIWGKRVASGVSRFFGYDHSTECIKDAVCSSSFIGTSQYSFYMIHFAYSRCMACERYAFAVVLHRATHSFHLRSHKWTRTFDLLLIPY